MTIGDDNQPYTDGYKVKFEIYLGVNRKGTLSVDLAVGTGITGDIVTQEPVAKLALPKLLTAPYRLYPVVDQIADKVCATMTEFKGEASSREKDLVDLVVLAKTQQIDGKQLRIAISTEGKRRQMEPISHFKVPSTWGGGYIKLSKPVPHCKQYGTVQLAADLVKSLVDPALANQADGSSWSCDELRWVQLADV